MLVPQCSSALYLFYCLSILGGIVSLLFILLSTALSICRSLVVFVLPVMSVAYVSCQASASVTLLLFWLWFSNCPVISSNVSIFCPWSCPQSSVISLNHCSRPYWNGIIISEGIIVLVSFWLCFYQCFMVVTIVVCIYWWSIKYWHNASYWLVK